MRKTSGTSCCFDQAGQKTTLPILFANELGIFSLKMDCGTVRDPEEWFGKRGAANGATYFELLSW